jgi:uncharacterized protein (DUF4415 family)
MSDDEIDVSEIPEVDQRSMERARLRHGFEDVPPGKTRVNIYLDNAIVHYFKMKARGRGYQTLINESLAEVIRRQNLEDVLRRVIREEMRANR